MRKILSDIASAIFFVAVVTFSVYLLFGKKGLVQRIRLEVEKRNLVKQVEKLEKENAILKEKIHRIETNPFEVEKIAREKYGMIKKGEVIYKIKEK